MGMKTGKIHWYLGQFAVLLKKEQASGDKKPGIAEKYYCKTEKSVL